MAGTPISVTISYPDRAAYIAGTFGVPLQETEDVPDSVRPALEGERLFVRHPPGGGRLSWFHRSRRT